MRLALCLSILLACPALADVNLALTCPDPAAAGSSNCDPAAVFDNPSGKVVRSGLRWVLFETLAPSDSVIICPEDRRVGDSAETAATACPLKQVQRSDLVVTPPPTGTGTVALKWVPPTHYKDGAALTDLAGYRIIYGVGANLLTRSIDIPNPTASSYTVDGLMPGTWYFAVKAYTSKAESEPSNLVNKVIASAPPPPPPNPPTGLTVTEEKALGVSHPTRNKSTLTDVGTVAIGTPCIKTETVNGYYAVDRSKVKRRAGVTSLPNLVVARC